MEAIVNIGMFSVSVVWESVIIKFTSYFRA